MTVITTILAVLGSIFLLLIIVIVLISVIVSLWAKRVLKQAELLSTEGGLKEANDLSSGFFNLFSMIPLAGGQLSESMVALPEGITFCDTVIPAILADWDLQALQDRATFRSAQGVSGGQTSSGNRGAYLFVCY